MSSLPWMQLYLDELDDERALALAVALGDADAWRLVVALKAWCWRHRESGHVGDLPPPLLAHACRWRGDATLLARALRDCGVIGVDGAIAGWADRHAPQLERAERERERAAMKRAGYKVVAVPQARRRR